MSELAKYIQESDVEKWMSGTYAKWNVWIFKSPFLTFDCVDSPWIDKNPPERGTTCTLRTRLNKNVNFPVMGQFTVKLFCKNLMRCLK